MCDRGAGAAQRVQCERSAIVEDRRVTEPVEVLLTGSGIADVDGVRRRVERTALHDAGKPEAVVAVEVRHADRSDVGRRHVRDRHLPLGALPRIEEHAGGVEAKEVAVVVAVARRDLRRRAEHHYFAHRSSHSLRTVPFGGRRTHNPVGPGRGRAGQEQRDPFSADRR